MNKSRKLTVQNICSTILLFSLFYVSFNLLQVLLSLKLKLRKTCIIVTTPKTILHTGKKSKSGTSNNVIMIYRLSEYGIHRDPGLHERRNIVMHTA